MSRRFGGVIERAQAVNQTQALGVDTGPHAALSDGIDLLPGLLATRGDALQEHVIAALNFSLQQRTSFRSQGAIETHLRSERVRAYPIDVDANLAECLINSRDDRENADRPGQCRRAGPDLIGRG